MYIEVDNQLVNKSFKEYECQFRARTRFDKVGNKEHFISMILSGELQKYTGTLIMKYYTCKLLSDMGYYEDIYDYVKVKGGPYFEMLTAETESCKTKH